MALYRSVHLSFWTDGKVDEMFSPEDKYFMLYLLTNPHTNIIGCYEIGVKAMAYELGYSRETISTLLDRFCNKYSVIEYDSDTSEVFIKKWYKYNWTTSPKIDKPILTAIAAVKNEEYKKKLYELFAQSGADRAEKIPYQYHIEKSGYGIDTTDTVTVTNTVSTTDTETISYSEVSKKEEKENNNYNTTRAGAREGVKSYDEIFEEMYVSELVKDAVIEFIRHLQVNGIKLINSRLEMILVNLDIRYGNDDTAKVQEIREAIKCGYKRLPCEGNGAWA